MTQNNNYNSVSCLYDLLDLQQSGSWSSDGTIILQRPPASSKLDKIKFRSFSANIKNSLQGLQVPTITGRLTANVQLIGKTTVSMDSGLYDDGIRDTLQETEQPTLTITNQYGITNFTPNKSNLVNSNFVLEEFSAPITTSFADSINTIIEQGKYEFKKLLGIIDPNNIFDETEKANAQASAFQTMNYSGASASGYINTNPNFNQYGYYLGGVQQYVTYVLYDDINNIQPSYNNYIAAYLLGTGDVQEASFNAMFEDPNINFRVSQLNTTDISVEPTVITDNSKTIFDNIIINAGIYSTRNVYDSFNGVVLDCGIYENFNNYVLLECDIATNVNRSDYFKLSYIINNISRLRFISNGQMCNNNNYGSIDWSYANNLTTLLTQFFNNFVQHFPGINTEQTYIYSFKFYPIVRQDTFHTMSFNIFCINPTTNTWYTSDDIFNVDELGYNGYFDNEPKSDYGSLWNIQEINASEDYYVITISDNESFFTTLTDQHYSQGTIVGANWFYDALNSDGYIYALQWKHTLNKNCFYVVVPYTDSNGHYNEHNFRILFRHNYHQETDSWLEYVENTSYYWPAIFIRGFDYEGNFIYICNDAVNERYKIFAGKNKKAGFQPDSAGLEENIFYNVSSMLKTEMQDIQANGTLLKSVDISNTIVANNDRVRNQVFIETTIWNDDTELSFTTNSDENYHCVYAKGGYYAKCWERNPVTPSAHEYNYVFCNSAVKLTFGTKNTYTPWTPATIVEKDESTGTYKWSQDELQHITNYTNRPYIYGIANENTFCDKIFAIDDRGYITCPVLALYKASDSPNSPYCANIVFSLDIFTDPEVLEFNLFGKQYPLNLRDVNNMENYYYNTSYQVYENRPSFNIARYSFDKNIFIQNKEYYDTLSSFLLLNNTDMTLKLICDAYPTLNNIVFYLNETSMIDFKESTTAPTEPNIKCRIVDAAGDVLTPEAASTIYSNITICVDWQFFN